MVHSVWGVIGFCWCTAQINCVFLYLDACSVIWSLATLIHSMWRSWACERPAVISPQSPCWKQEMHHWTFAVIWIIFFFFSLNSTISSEKHQYSSTGVQHEAEWEDCGCFLQLGLRVGYESLIKLLMLFILGALKLNMPGKPHQDSCFLPIFCLISSFVHSSTVSFLQWKRMIHIKFSQYISAATI